MYGLSRAIYRELAEEIVEDPWSGGRPINHERVLRACESAIERLATDRHYFAHPARTLFGDIRAFFPMASQLRVLSVVERYLELADELLRRQPAVVQCRASTRRGTPCQRTPLPHNSYCPSHQHLADTEHAPPLAA
jgi:hypothetical protein